MTLANHRKQHLQISSLVMPNHEPIHSRSGFRAALDKCHSSKADRCYLCHGELNSAIALDPAYLYEGLAIELPCCPHILVGKKCFLRNLAQCPAQWCFGCFGCFGPWYRTVPRSNLIFLWWTWWREFIIVTSCVLYMTTYGNQLTLVDDETPISGLGILGILWWVSRPTLEVVLVFAPFAPVDERLQRYLLRYKEGIVFNVVEAYIELPPAFSIPLMVVSQALILYHLRQTALQAPKAEGMMFD